MHNKRLMIFGDVNRIEFKQKKQDSLLIECFIFSVEKKPRLSVLIKCSLLSPQVRPSQMMLMC